MRKLFVLALATYGILSCADQPPVAPIPRISAIVPKGTVEVVIQQSTFVSGDSALFTVNVVGNDVPVAAYQGNVTFAPGSLEILSIRAADARDGEFRVVNDADAAQGSLRFAGFAPISFGSTEAVRIVARVKGALSAVHLTGALDIAGETAGTAIHSDNLRRSEGLRDAKTNRLLVP